MKTSYSLALLLSGAFVLGLLAGNTATLRDGIAQGYGGLISGPAKQSAGTAKDEPPGYSGLIPGHVPSDEGETAPEAAQTQNTPPPISYGAAPATPALAVPATRRAALAMTPARNSVPVRPVETVDDIKFLAATEARRVDWKTTQMPAGLMESMRVLFKPDMKERMNRPSMRINGMLIKEYSTKEKIDRLMAAVANPALDKEARRSAAKKAREKLEAHAKHLDIRSEFPDDLYKQLGLPDTYVRETQEAEQKSLARVQAAILVLQKFE